MVMVITQLSLNQNVINAYSNIDTDTQLRVSVSTMLYLFFGSESYVKQIMLNLIGKSKCSHTLKESLEI
jgi:hypothetical protein